MAHSFTSPYRQNHYMGEAASYSEVETFISNAGWTLSPGMVYYDTTAGSLKLYNGSAWEEITAGGSPTLSAVLTSGNETAGQDLVVSDGDTLTISGDGGSGGASLSIESGASFTIADIADCTFTGTPSTGTDPVNKDYVDSVAQGLDWQDSVLDRYDPGSGTPGTPTAGDRYIATATGSGWTENNIYEYNGSGWDETVVDEGMSCWVEDEDVLYVYYDSSWVKFGSTVDHANLSNLNSSTYYHLTQTDHNTLTGSGDASSLHHHDGRYFTETELGGVTSGSEGATLIGTADLGNLGSAVNVQDALEAVDTHVGSSDNPHTVTLDQAYTAGQSVAIDAGDLAITFGGAYSLDLDLSGITGDDADGFIVRDGTYQFALLSNAAGSYITLDADLYSANIAAADAITLTSDAKAVTISSTSSTIDIDAGSGQALNIGVGDATHSGQTINIGGSDGNGPVDIVLTAGDPSSGTHSVKFAIGDATYGGFQRQASGTDNGFYLGATSVYVTSILDEDDMSSDLDTALATQQSIKAYVDNAVTDTYWARSTGVLSPETSGDVVSITVDDAEDAIPLTLTQDDVTNSNPALSIMGDGQRAITSQWSPAGGTMYSTWSASQSSTQYTTSVSTWLNYTGTIGASTMAITNISAYGNADSGSLPGTAMAIVNIDAYGLDLNSVYLSTNLSGSEQDYGCANVYIGAGEPNANRTVQIGTVDTTYGGYTDVDIDGISSTSYGVFVRGVSDGLSSYAVILRGDNAHDTPAAGAGGIEIVGGVDNWDGSQDAGVKIHTTGNEDILINAGAGDVSTSGANISLEAAYSTGDITFDAREMDTPITLNDASNTDLSADFAASSIIGALNELNTETPRVQTGSSNPGSGGGTAAGIGDIFVDTTSDVCYMKYGSDDTEWTVIG